MRTIAIILITFVFGYGLSYAADEKANTRTASFLRDQVYISRKQCLAAKWVWAIRADGKVWCQLPGELDNQLHEAVENGDIGFVENLMSIGLPVSYKLRGHYGATLLVSSIYHKQCKLAAFLLENGARMDEIPLLPSTCSHLFGDLHTQGYWPRNP